MEADVQIAILAFCFGWFAHKLLIRRELREIQLAAEEIKKTLDEISARAPR